MKTQFPIILCLFDKPAKAANGVSRVQDEGLPNGDFKLSLSETGQESQLLHL